MLTVLDLPHDNVLGVRIDGRLDADDVDRILTEMKRKLEALEAAGRPAKLRVYVELERFAGITLEGLIRELQGMLPHLSSFEKKAVVSDIGWVETATRIFTPLTDWWVEGRHYRPDRKDEALAWVAE